MNQLFRHTAIILFISFIATLIACGGGGGGGGNNSNTGGETINVFQIPDTGQTQSYTNTFGEDSDYIINPPSYTDKGDSTIRDNMTGLLWQEEDDNIERTFNDAIIYCEGLLIGNQSDWRIPTIKELITIVNYGTYLPLADGTYFPNTNNTDYWSATNSASYIDYQWGVNFGYGMVGLANKTELNHVRCVSGSTLTYPVLKDNGDGTISDMSSGLMWHKQEIGIKQWESAINYCEGLIFANHDDWYLPNIKELMSLVDYSRDNPAIDTNYFPFTISERYWSSTTDYSNTTYVWSVNFASGYIAAYGKNYYYNSRCVRRFL